MNNYRFNRLEKNGQHEYINYFPKPRKIKENSHNGFIKCKLAHNKFYSILIPEQIYIDYGGELYWFQPLFFSANTIAKFDEYGICNIGVDISYGERLIIEFRDDNLISKLCDGSLFYKCIIKGPKNLYMYRTGKAKIINNKPFIKLYHHTTRSAKQGILNSNEFWSSNWNIQGTKEIVNISYLYLTPLPKIVCRSDLVEIAMSSVGKIALRVDQNNSNTPDAILNVYRESTDNRTHSLAYYVESSLLATQHCYRHLIPNGFGYHQIVSPFIHRIGVEPKTTISISRNILIPKSPKILKYAVVGDATTFSGLVAPYDEEETDEKLKLEFICDPDELIRFWIKNGMTNQYDNKDVEVTEFK